MTILRLFVQIDSVKQQNHDLESTAFPSFVSFSLSVQLKVKKQVDLDEKVEIHQTHIKVGLVQFLMQQATESPN